jgi:hypothetical protein
MDDSFNIQNILMEGDSCWVRGYLFGSNAARAREGAMSRTSAMFAVLNMRIEDK